MISGQLVVDSGQSLVDGEEERIAKEKELAERLDGSIIYRKRNRTQMFVSA